jgi:hypothetical protein
MMLKPVEYNHFFKSQFPFKKKIKKILIFKLACYDIDVPLGNPLVQTDDARNCNYPFKIYLYNIERDASLRREQ